MAPFFFKQKTAYEITTRLVGSEMCIRDSLKTISLQMHLNSTKIPLESFPQPPPQKESEVADHSGREPKSWFLRRQWPNARHVLKMRKYDVQIFEKKGAQRTVKGTEIETMRDEMLLKQ